MASQRLSKYFFSKEALLIPFGLGLFITACFINKQNNPPLINLTKQETAININKNLLLFINAGNKRLFTDLLWVQTLMESDIEHYKKKDLNNWLFLRFNTISILDPEFYENYAYGGQFLAIVKDDLDGASIIYDKGLQHYPNDFVLNYNAGFLNYYEMENYSKGLTYLEKIVNHPRAPIFMQSIINKLKVSSGIDLKEVFSLVLHNYNNTTDEALKNRLGRDLYAIKAEIDLVCLNNQNANCSRTDFEGKSYIYRDGSYYSPKEFIRYRISRRNSEKNARINFIK